VKSENGDCMNNVVFDALKKYIFAFVQFCYNFLIGETPEFFILTVVVVLLALLVKGSNFVAIPAILFATLTVLALSLYRACRRRPDTPDLSPTPSVKCDAFFPGAGANEQDAGIEKADER